MPKVMDASALIAYLRGEQGAEIVESVLMDRNNECTAHAINLCEVFYEFMRAENEETALNAIADLSSVGLVIRNDMDFPFWQTAARIKAKYRRVSLADCLAIALADRLGCEIVTSDHHEFDALVDQGVCRVMFIR
jgi:predicted nucleic acid-binding protein